VLAYLRESWPGNVTRVSLTQDCPPSFCNSSF